MESYEASLCASVALQHQDSAAACITADGETMELCGCVVSNMHVYECSQLMLLHWKIDEIGNFLVDYVLSHKAAVFSSLITMQNITLWLNISP